MPLYFKYTLKAIFVPYVMCLFVFFSLIFALQFIQSSEVLLQGGGAYIIILKILALLGISYIPLISPFCLLFGILFGHERLSNQHEFTAFSSVGIHKRQLCYPAICLSIINFFICLVAIHTWGPNAKYISNSLENVLKKKAATSAFQPGVFLTQDENYAFYAEDESADGELKKVFIFNKNSDDLNFVYSKNGSFEKNPEYDFGFKLKNGTLYSLGLNTSMLANFQDYFVNIFNIESESSSRETLSNQTSRKLKKDLKKPDLEPFNDSENPNKKNEIKTEINKRNMFAFSNFIFLALSLLFSMRIHSRSSKGSGVFLALVFSISFWILLFSAEYFAIQTKNPLLVYTPILPLFIFCVFYYKYINLKSII